MIRFGTCSWKYDSWKGIIYPEESKINFLEEYSKHFNTVEVDQWFWSLFPPGKVVLPKNTDVESYSLSVPNDFLFTIKVPNSLTLTHYYKKNKTEPLQQNPFFLSADLYEQFIRILGPLKNNIGCLIFQFEYLNKQKMSSLNEFQNRFREFHSGINTDLPIGIEIRNPNYLNESYFNFLSDLSVIPVFLEGYFMPPVTEIFYKYKDKIKSSSIVLRLHGADRKGIEKIANDNWNKIYIKRDEEIKKLVKMIKDIEKEEVDLFVNVNNHFEGSAPITIEKIKSRI